VEISDHCAFDVTVKELEKATGLPQYVLFPSRIRTAFPDGHSRMNE